MRGIFFDEDDARAAADVLLRGGFRAEVVREWLQGEDDDEDHPWAVETDAPEFVVDVLAEEYDGWVEHDEPPAAAPSAPPLDLPRAPRPDSRSAGQPVSP